MHGTTINIEKRCFKMLCPCCAWRKCGCVWRIYYGFFLRCWKHSGISSMEKHPCSSLARRLSGPQHNIKRVSAAGITHRVVQRPSRSDPRRSPDLYTTHHQSGGQSIGLQEEKPLGGSFLYIEYSQPLFRTDRKITFCIFTNLSYSRGVTRL
jgi:hypothetical protein